MTIDDESPTGPTSATAAAAEAPITPSGPSDVFDPSEEVVSYERSPRDVLRVVLLALAAIVVVVLTRYLGEGVDGVEENLSELLDLPWERARLAVDALLIIMVLVAGVATLVVPLATRRLRLFGYTFTANIVTGLVVLGIASWLPDGTINRGASGESAEQLARGLGTDVAGTAQLVAAFVAISPFVNRRWRRMGAWLVTVILVLRLVVVSNQTTHAMMVLTVGATVGSAVLLAFGRPNTRPRISAILAALRTSGVPVAELDHAAVDARGSVPYFATLDDGSRIFAKVLGSDERAADLLFRLYRMVRLKNVGDERPFSSLRRTVEHEALVALQARDVGVQTPRLRTVAPVGSDSFLLAYDLIDGRSLDRVEPDELTDDVLVGLWEQIALLRRHRIAHRDLRLANVFLDDAGSPWIIDFGFSEIAASDALLRADLAQLLASVAVDVGAERAVTPAVQVLGRDVVATSLGRLQVAALSGATQTDLKHHKGLIDEVRAEVERQCGVDDQPLEPLTRFGGRQVFTLVMLVAVFYFLIPQLADLPGIVNQVKAADWVWAVPLVIASAFTYFAATLSLFGSIPAKLPPVPTLAAQVGSSFASKVAPAGLGGMAMNVRYLQRQGVDTTVATSGIGLNAMAGVVGHLTLVAIFIGWAGREAFSGFTLPSPKAFLIGVGVVVVVGALAMAVPTTRKLVIEKLLPILGKATAGLHDVLSSPGKLVLLIGGSTLVTLSYVVAFFYAGQAFGIDLRFASVGAVYLVGSAVATAAPTPGGLGAMEAALIGGLIAAGVDKEVAVPSVFLYRLATFWVPILPGWACFTWLRRTDRL